MMNYECCIAEPTREIQQESAKIILENTDAILNELASELFRIDDAIYSPSPRPACNDDNKKPSDECLIGTLIRQRETANSLLKLATHIREGLW